MPETTWRGPFTNLEVNHLHAEAFGHRVYRDDEWDWQRLVSAHSLGWVVAREGEPLVGFANVVWDGLVHAWVQDVMVAASSRRRGVGRSLIEVARQGAGDAGCEWLHVDFDDDLGPFYIDACGFTPANGGLLRLR